MDGRVLDQLEGVRCKECRLPLLHTDHGRWRAYWIDDGPEEKLLFYCPECFEREFGAD